MGFSSGDAPLIIKTGLDKVFYSKFNDKVGPNMADVDQSDIFKQGSAKNSAVITTIMADAGLWDEAASDIADVAEGTIREDDSRTFTVAKFHQALKISKDLFDDESWGAVKEMVTKMGMKGKLKSRDKGFDLLRNAFGTTTTNDGVAAISDSHTNLAGDTIDNLMTAALSPTTLKTLIAMLAEQKDQAGDVVGHEARCLLVPNRLFDYAFEITESKLKPDTTDNNVNAFSLKYNLYVKQSNRLGAALSGGSDTRCLLFADYHTCYRWIRKAVTTDIVDYKYDDKNRYVYKGFFREVYGIVSYEGIAGTNATT